jgi:hypothetical protein
MAINPAIRVSPVQDEADLEQFLQLPWRLYQQDPSWVPPLLPQLRQFLDRRRRAFFEIGAAQYFLTHIYLVKHTPCNMADFSLIPENLRHWIKVIKAFGGQHYKTFRVFEREI